MKSEAVIMTMPVCVEIIDAASSGNGLAHDHAEDVFAYFRSIEEKFSRFKPHSELSQLRAGRLSMSDVSADMREVLALCKETSSETHGFFSTTRPDGTLDTSGLVKGWAIHNAANMLDSRGFRHFLVEIGGDIEVRGLNSDGEKWCVGIKNPFEKNGSIVRVLSLTGCGIATSGTYERGAHIYDPHTHSFIHESAHDIASITVIGPNVYEADRFATAAFAMGERGVAFIEALPGLEAYQIHKNGKATYTSRFEKLCA